METGFRPSSIRYTVHWKPEIGPWIMETGSWILYFRDPQSSRRSPGSGGSGGSLFLFALVSGHENYLKNLALETALGVQKQNPNREKEDPKPTSETSPFWDRCLVAWVTKMEATSPRDPSQIICFPTSERVRAFSSSKRFCIDLGPAELHVGTIWGPIIVDSFVFVFVDSEPVSKNMQLFDSFFDRLGVWFGSAKRVYVHSLGVPKSRQIGVRAPSGPLWLHLASFVTMLEAFWYTLGPFEAQARGQRLPGTPNAGTVAMGSRALAGRFGGDVGLSPLLHPPLPQLALPPSLPQLAPARPTPAP